MGTTMKAFRLSLVVTLVAVLALALSACAPSAAPSPTAAPAATTAPAAAAPTAAPAATTAPTAAAKPTEAAKPTAAATAQAAAASGPNIDRIKKAGKLVVLQDATFAPMEFKNDKGEIVGADVDIATELAKDLGVKLEIQNTNWDGIFAALKAKKGDAIISSVTITDERKKEMAFTNPYFAGGQVILVKSDNTTIKGPSDLAGKTVGVQIDTTGQAAAEKIQGIKEIKKYDGGADACLAVDTGKVEATVMDKMVAGDYAKQHPSVKMVDPKPFAAEDIGIAVNPDATDLAAAFNTSIAAMQKDGRLNTILDKYGLK